MDDNIIISLPKNEETLNFKTNYDINDKKSIINLGIIMFSWLKKKQISWDNEKIEELLRNERDEHEKKIANNERDTEIKITESIKIFREEKERLERLLYKEKDRMRDYWLERENKIRQEYDILLVKARSKYESTFVHTQNSTILGQDGENYTFCELNKAFPSAEIEDCRKQSGRGDFILTDNDFVMMIECKNYKKNVLKPEVEKFYRDVDNNNDIKCAVLVSLKSGICAKPDFHFEVRDGKPVLFLHKVATNIDNLLLAVRFFKLIMSNEGFDLANKEMLEKIKNLAPPIKRFFRNQRKSLDKFKKNMDDAFLIHEQQIIELFSLISIKF
jgi:hypothetical protein